MLDTISALLFFALIGLYIIKERKHIEVHGKVLIIRRWKRGKKKLEIFVRKNRRFLLVIGNIAIATGLLAMLAGLYYVFSANIRQEQAFGIVLPSVADIRYPAPFVGIPFWYWLVGIFTVVIVHETMHGLLAIRERVGIKNYGIVLLTLFPIGAFVEPNEKKFKKLRGLPKLRILAAGSFANIVLALLFVLILLVMQNAFLVENGFLITAVANNSPAYYANLSGVIVEINGTPIRNARDLAAFLSELEPGSVVEIRTTTGNFIVELAERNNKSFLGIAGVTNREVVKELKQLEPLIMNLMSLLSWLVIINLGVGVFNMLPIKPLDGGLMLEEILTSRLKRKKAEKVTKLVSIITLALVITNFAIGYLV